MRNTLHLLLLLLLLITTSAQAATSLTARETTINVTPGGNFSVTLDLVITGTEQVSGVDYYWRVDGATAGMFSIIGRDISDSFFSDPLTSDSNATKSPGNQLAPRNGYDLGASPEEWDEYATAGSHFLATYTFSVGESVSGSFLLTTSSNANSGWVSPDFSGHDFTRHAAITLNVGQPIPEPATCVALLGAVALALTFFVRRLRRRDH